MTNADSYITPTGDHRDCEPRGGITLREYYAGLAMQGLMANAALRDINNIAERAVEWSDAVIIALNKPSSH